MEFWWLNKLTTRYNRAGARAPSPISTSQLLDFKPMAAINWSMDATGLYLDKFLQTNVADALIYNVGINYFTGLNMQIHGVYFDGGSLRNYAYYGLKRNYTNPDLQAAMEHSNNLSRTNDALALTEDILDLGYYYKNDFPYKTLELNYDHDKLDVALIGLLNYSPLNYADHLANQFTGLNFNSNTCLDSYLVPEKYPIYGSSRLGEMSAASKRKVADNNYSRKLGGKSYELSDHLGNVVAVVSDKKLHPIEATVNGAPVLQSDGYQADIKGRYDYYPFGMEIMSRSGDFSTVNYETEVFKTIYDGLLENCSYYDVELSPNTVSCTVGQDLYGRDYVENIEFVRVGGDLRSTFNFTIDLPVDDVFGNLDPLGNYEVALSFNALGRVISCLSPKSGTLTSPSEGPGATDLEIRLAEDKVLYLEFSGSEIQTFATNNKLELTIKASWGHTSGSTPNVQLTNIKVTTVEDNTSVPLAFRNDESYTYGFNGMEKDDEVKGSGNSYDFGARIYDPRLGRWLSVDPLAHLRTWVSPYNFVQNNPIMRTDPTGALDGEYDVTHDKDGNEVKTKTSPLGDAEGIDFNHHLDGDQKGNTEIVNNNTGQNNWIKGGVGLMRGYTQRNNNTNWNSIFSEWKSETGPQNSLMFGRDNTMNKEIRTSNLYHGARNDYLKKQAFDFDGKITKGTELISFANYLPALKAAVLSGNNMTMQMMGTVNVSFYNIGNHQRLVFINDSKSVESFNRLGSFMGYQFSDFLDRVPSRVTRQTYMWIDNNVEE